MATQVQTHHVIHSSSSSSNPQSNTVGGGRFKVGRRIGEGSFGVVFKGAFGLLNVELLALGVANFAQGRTCCRAVDDQWRLNLCVVDFRGSSPSCLFDRELIDVFDM